MKQRVPNRTKREIQDDSIMGTNNSSIVSKRSVERLYYPESHFFRPFVKKPQRRSPLINRGYWLRMHAVDHVVRHFLEEPCEKKKIIINLGSGYDPLPFQCLARYPTLCKDVTFVDVDYAQLMVKKSEVVDQTVPFRKLLTNFHISPPDSVINLRSNEYLAVGCDLRDVEKLKETLAEEFDMDNCLILCIAEVSISYMDVDAADALIRWAAALRDVRFCLLEQFVPGGPQHPFAKTMIQHFNKLQTPLRCIQKYPLLEDQRRRFADAGWPVVAARSLWDLWEDSQFLRMEERVALNEVEPFDEWEEFALFASHYFLLVATKHLDANSTYGYIGPDQRHLDVRPVVHDTLDVVQKPQAFLTFRYVENPRERGRRRFGAAVQTAAKLVGHHGGLGPQTRLNSTDVYTDGEIDDLIWNSPPVSIAARMCHTITPLNNEDCLLVGGRTSPGNALADCWVRRSQSWERIDDLPSPRYRHCAALVSLEKEDPSVLICGGKNSAGTVLEDYLIWRSEYGWQTVQVNGVAPKPRFGASVITGIETSGVLVGGMTEDGIILSECWHWFIENHSGIITISFHNPWQSNAGPSGSDCLMARFGASLLWSSVGLLYIGGISRRGLTPQEYEVMLVYPEIRTKSASQTERRRANHFEKVDLVFDGPRPLLVGHTVANVEAGELLILGGGAVCFSFGTYWNLGTWTVHTSSDLSRPPWHLREAAEAVPSLRSTVPDECQLNGDVDSNPSVPHLTAIDRVRVASARAFAAIVMEGRPTVLEGLNIGSCTKVWDVDYLRKRVGASRQVVVHEAATDHMDFHAKNFSYVTKNLGDFLDQVENGQRQYLRSLASESPAEKAAELSRDFPEIAGDFSLPPELCLVTENAHSSPLRISGPVTMWLHYDVMANVLCQIRGSKRLVLYPPSDVTQLQFPAGASSSILDVFDPTSATRHLLTNTHPYEAILHPGDVLFIPPCWAHIASPTDGISIAVNVFFRNLKTGYAAGKDVYGNRDLWAYERGRINVGKIAKAFEGLPIDIGKFYLERLAEELKEKAHMFGSAG